MIGPMTSQVNRRRARTSLGTVATIVAALLLVLVGSGSPAGAHGGDESVEASALVQQAIALLVDSPDDAAPAAEKVKDALATSDQEGVDVDLLDQAATALASGDTHGARSLLERSIGAKPHLNDADPAPIGKVDSAAPDAEAAPTGADPGVAVANDPLETSRNLDGGDWASLAALIALGAVGVLLSLRFRPQRKTTRSNA